MAVNHDVTVEEIVRGFIVGSKQGDSKSSEGLSDPVCVADS